MTRANFTQFQLIEQNPKISQEHMNPNFKFFPQIMKILKLNHRNHVYVMHTQKHPKHQKFQKYSSLKILKNLCKMHVN